MRWGREKGRKKFGGDLVILTGPGFQAAEVSCRPDQKRWRRAPSGGHLLPLEMKRPGCRDLTSRPNKATSAARESGVIRMQML